MSHHQFSSRVIPEGSLPGDTFGRLVANFKFASHIPLAGGHDTGRHIYLALQVPTGVYQGVYEAAVNIRSDENTAVLFAERMERLAGSSFPQMGFTAGVNLAYGTGAASGVDFMNLKDGDFQEIQNDELFDKINSLTQGCDAAAVYGVTYSSGNGIHDVHMNSGTDAEDQHADGDRDHQDGAIAFYFNLNGNQAFSHWVFIKFKSQHVVNPAPAGNG